MERSGAVTACSDARRPECRACPGSSAIGVPAVPCASLRAGDTGLLHDLAPLRDLCPDKDLEVGDRRRVDREEAHLEDLLLDLGLHHEGLDLGMQALDDVLGR